MKNYRYHNKCIRRNQAQGGGSKPDPLAFFPGVCSGGYLFSSGGPTPITLPPPIFTLVWEKRILDTFTQKSHKSMTHCEPMTLTSCISFIAKIDSGTLNLVNSGHFGTVSSFRLSTLFSCITWHPHTCVCRNFQSRISRHFVKSWVYQFRAEHGLVTWSSHVMYFSAGFFV